MPITLRYGAPGTLLGLARATGVGQRQQREAELDLAFIDSSLTAQARNARIAAQVQAQDQAFALQTAAATRIARTPTRVAAPDAVLGRMQWQAGREELQQQTQIEQLNRMLAAEEINQAQYERAKLGIMAGIPGLVRGVTPPKPTKPGGKITDPAVKAVMHIEKRTQRHLERQIAIERRKLEIDPYADPTQERIRVDVALKKVEDLEEKLQASYQREDIALGVKPALRQVTSAEQDALMDVYLAETKGDIEAAKRLMAEREGQ